MTRKSNYVIQKDEKTFCPKCHGDVWLLCKENADMKPAFYICFSCQFIAQLGRGEVFSSQASEQPRASTPVESLSLAELATVSGLIDDYAEQLGMGGEELDPDEQAVREKIDKLLEKEPENE